ncbi:MAG TPA: ABC transporter ATP-binding protein [Pyrinomonadaceae bacterium]|nr:ABC transporter ATP-binding protein [Pyrinomonadaceae bacterium]
MQPIIEVEGIGKRYFLRARETVQPTLREAFKTALDGAAKVWLRPNGHKHHAIWALRDISFQVAPGEVVGVIGSNGAGKSTLLKILARTTRPTTGAANLFGRAGSLLGISTGFHPDLTGRENIYLNGAILGMGRREIARKFDEIVAFAQIEEFLDTPTKRYSGGMYLRLGFAIAAHLDPEILLLDEVLTMADASFQQKCLDMIRATSARGTTVMFVSHSLDSVKSVCGRVIHIDSGRICGDGAPQTVIADYLRQIDEREVISV